MGLVPPDLDGRTLAGCTVAVALVGLLGVLGGGVLGAGVGPLGGSGGEETPTATAAPVPTVTTTTVPGLATVPGVDATGITDSEALARHHAAGLADSHTVWADLYWRPANGTGAWTQRDIDIFVEEGRYLLRAEVEPANGTDRRPVLSVYGDGEARYTASYAANGSARYRSLAADEPSPSRVPPPAALRERVLAGLTTTAGTTTYTGVVEEEGAPYYRFVARGKPTTDLPTPGGASVAPERVDDYAVVVLVGRDGRVETVEARYTLPERLTPRRVRFSLTYDRIGRTVAARPDWVDRATNGSA